MRLLLVLIFLGFSPELFALDCGGENKRPCNVWERIPSCNDSLVERHGRCMADTVNNMANKRPEWCGRDKQPPCKINEFIPSCVPGLIERSGACVAENSHCGRKNQPPCDSAREGGKHCLGATIYELVLDSVTNTCQKRADVCGTLGKRPCTLANKNNFMLREYDLETEMPCGGDLVIKNGVCSRHASAVECGSHDASPCVDVSGNIRQDYCNRGWEISNGKCVRASQPANVPVSQPASQSCGALGARPCRIGERSGSSCDRGLREDFIKNRCIQ